MADDNSFPFDPSWLGESGGFDWGSLLGGLGGTLGSLAGGVGTAAAYAGPILSIIQGLSTGPHGDIPISENAAAMADPFSSQRAGYQKQLSGLLSDPSSFQMDPGYKFALQQGQDAIAGKSAALYGTERTGTLAPELAKFTEGYANQAYNDRITQLMQLSGANTGSPSAAGGLLMQGAIQQGQDVGMGLQTLANLLKAPAGPQSVTINQNNATGGAGGAGGAASGAPYGSAPADLSRLLGTGAGSLFEQLGLGNQGFRTNMFGTDPATAARLAAILGYSGGSTSPETFSALNPLASGPYGSFAASQGGGFAGLANSLRGIGADPGSGGNWWEDFGTGDPEWGSAMMGTQPFDWGGSGVSSWVNQLMSGGSLFDF